MKVGIPVFIDTERDSWNMDPVALVKAFKIYPEVKVIVIAYPFGSILEITSRNRVVSGTIGC